MYINLCVNYATMLNTEYILSNCNLSEIVKMSPLFL